MREALRLMDEQDRWRAAKLEQLRVDRQAGREVRTHRDTAADEPAVDLRSFPFGRHVIFDEPIDDGIDVVRVLHGARDVDAALAGAS